MRRADRAAREDYLGRRLGPLDLAPARKLDAGRALSVEQHAMDERAGDDLEVGALHRRAQIGPRRALPAPPAPGLLDPADPLAGARRQMVDVGAVFEPELLARLDH